MKRLPTILIGLAFALASAAAVRADEGLKRSGYSYVRETAGEVSVDSRYNGRVEARRNLPITAGDEISVSEGGRADMALADGNALFVGGGTRARFVSLRDQQGEEDQVSAINLIEGSVVLSAFGDNEQQIPRIDTEDATVYLGAGSRVRVNVDPRRGTAVIGRAGTAEVRTRAGTFRVRAGEFLQARGDEEPSVERGAFSRDRFDIWVADRMEALTETRSASAQYVDDQYGSDVASLDGYGDWQYNDEYNTNVWSPRVEAGWTPYSYGNWYYTPVGMNWWSYDPWGWFPFHYGNWFFSASWNHWCWAPGSVFSPAWVYWGFTPSWVGWCPIGFFSPFNNFNRANVFISINNVFSTRTINFRGWNFVGANNFGAAVSRMAVIPGSRIGERLGSTQIAVSSRPMVVRAQPGQTREAVQAFVREAPRVIERASSPADAARLAPILARQSTLPQATLEAVAQHAVVAERGRLAGPGVADVAPRGALVDRNRTLANIPRESTSRTVPSAPVGSAPRETRDLIGRGRPAPPSAAAPERAPVSEGRTGARPEDWRSRSVSPSFARPVERPEVRSFERARPDRQESAPVPEWRTRSRTVAPDSSIAPRSASPRGEGWRSRSDLPPARRVIEGAVPGRRVPEELPRSRSWRSPESEQGPPARTFRPEPRPEYRPREYRPESAPPSRVERAPAYAPPPRVERAPAYAPPREPRAEVHHAPPPPPPSDRGRKDR